MTEETQQSSETQTASQQADQNTVNVSSEAGKTKEGKKEKCRPMTKVVIRRLPPTMSQEQFLEQVSPLPEYDYMYFAKADMSLGPYAFSRAYIDFLDAQEIFGFREKFDNYVFVDSKGTEYPAVVEFAPFQRVPKKRVGKKKDLKCGTIESDPYYINFLESLKNQEADPANAQPKTEYSFQPLDHAPKKVTTTPLLDFLKQRKQEKQRLRDEKREEKRRRDLERKRSKDEPMVSKVLKNVEEKERDKDRELNRENKENKDEKEKIIQKDIKNRNKKEDRFRDKMGRDTKIPNKNFREDRVKDVKPNKKHEDKKFYNKKEDHESHSKDLKDSKEFKDRIQDEATIKERKIEEKRGKSYEKMRQEKKRLAESQKKQNTEAACEELDEDSTNVDDNGDEELEEARVAVEKPTKPKNKVIDNSKNDETEESNEILQNKYAEADSADTSPAEDSCDVVSQSREHNGVEDQHQNSSNDGSDKKSPTKSRIAKRRSSLESGGETGTGSKSGSSGTSSGHSGDNGENEGACLRRHKSLDGGNGSNLQKSENEEKEKDKKDPRLERRIRNKDRPAMEIYRPGMGKFSKQRLEREKGNEERATPSQSPTPSCTNANTYKSGKSSNSEVRSMTFKRSVSRDMP